MNGRVVLGYGMLVIASFGASWRAFSLPRPQVATVAATHPIAPVARSTSTTSDARVALAPVPLTTAEALSAYLSMRDDADPQPRLRLVEAWGRETHPRDDLDLPAQALVDADASVRAHAQFLFEREIARR